MKTNLFTTNRWPRFAGCLAAALALSVALSAPSGAFAQEVDSDKDKIKLKPEKAKIKTDDLKVKIKGEDAKELALEFLDVESEGRLVAGYVVPLEQRTFFRPVPAALVAKVPKPLEGIEMRYYNGSVYYVDAQTYRIHEVVDAAPFLILPEEIEESLAPGFVLAPEHRIYLRRIPATLAATIRTPAEGEVYYLYRNKVLYFNPATFEITMVAEVSGS